MSLVLDSLDNKLMDNFRGFVVKKDLVRQLKIGANVPVFVLEYLLANSCSTTDEEQIRKGIENVKMILQNHYVNPEESNLTQSKIRENRNFTVIDRIEVALDATRDKYWAQLLNSSIKNANIDDRLVTKHDKLLLGGIWAVIDLEYDAEIKIGNKVFPFIVKDIKPIQVSGFALDRLNQG